MPTKKRYHDDWLKAFVDFASFGEAPLKMLFWTGVSTVAGALRRRVWLDMKYFQWIPNFYIIMVAPAGIVSKSTTANIGMNLLRPLRDIKFGPDVITWQQLLTSLGKSTTHDPDPRLGITGEMYPMSAVTFCSDELGNLLKMKDSDLIDALVSLWDGKRGSFSKETKTQGGDMIENPFVNLIGCTTPSWISMNVPEYMIGGGFTSRCVFIYADAKRQLVPYVDEVVPNNFEDMKQKLTHDLEVISMMFGQYEIAPAARKWGKGWYREHWSKKPPNITGDQYAGYMSRKQTHIHKLSMVLAASRSDTLMIEQEHLEMAMSMVTAIEEDMPKVFGRIGQTDITRGSADIVAIVDNQPGISSTECFLILFRKLDLRSFNEALAGAQMSGQVHNITRSDGIHLYPGSAKQATGAPINQVAATPATVPATAADEVAAALKKVKP